MPTLILAESSLEIVPKELQNHASVTSYCKKNGKNPSDVLLDNSWHFAAMKGIKNEIKRGRPDIVHLTLLSVCNTPLYDANKLRVYVHTVNDKIISISNNTRLPKSYHRFQGLIEKLFKNYKIEVDNTTLLELDGADDHRRGRLLDMGVYYSPLGDKADAAVEAAFIRDFPLMVGVALVFSIFALIIILITDISYALLDPRIRYS